MKNGVQTERNFKVDKELKSEKPWVIQQREESFSHILDNHLQSTIVQKPHHFIFIHTIFYSMLLLFAGKKKIFLHVIRFPFIFFVIRLLSIFLCMMIVWFF